MSVTAGIVGTAKNTGKTTTLMAAMRECRDRGHRVRVTSIGFDGEDVDNVTGLPKPRIYCDRGTVFATARRCLRAGSAQTGVLAVTGMETALGELVVGVVEREGLVVLAGPNKTVDLERLLQTLDEVDGRAGITLVDGAFGRMAPMSVVDAVVLATGAARNQSAIVLAAETRDVVQVFDIPRLPEGWAGGDGWQGEFRFRGGGRLLLPEAAFLSAVVPPDGRDEVECLVIPGLVSPPALEALAVAMGPRLRAASVVLSSPASLLAGGDPAAAARAVARLRSVGARVWVRRRPELIGITVNPFYPERLSAGNYAPQYVDRRELLRAFRRRVRRPVWDVVEGGSGELGETLECLMKRGDAGGKEGVANEYALRRGDVNG